MDWATFFLTSFKVERTNGGVSFNLKVLTVINLMCIADKQRNLWKYTSYVHKFTGIFFRMENIWWTSLCQKQTLIYTYQ